MARVSHAHRGWNGLESTTLWSSQIYPPPYTLSYGTWSPPWMSPWCPNCPAYRNPMEVRDIFADYRLLLPIKPPPESPHKIVWKKAPAEMSSIFTFSARAAPFSPPSSSETSPSNIRTKQRRMQRLQKREMSRVKAFSKKHA